MAKKYTHQPLSGPARLTARGMSWLRSRRLPYENLRPALKVVDLFCGCGAMSLGVAQAAWTKGLGVEVALAVDVDPDSVAVFKRNFAGARVEEGLVEAFFDGGLAEDLTVAERQLRRSVGAVDVLVGGPPCQGHSDLNNHSRRDDPRNATYAKMARAALVLEPSVVLIENVPTARHDVFGVIDTTIETLRGGGYSVADRVLDLSRLGVPQTRKRHVILALRGMGTDATSVLDSVAAIDMQPRTVKWAIRDLLNTDAEVRFDSASTPSPVNRGRMAWLLENGVFDLPNSRRPQCHASGHSYNSMYGRLRWDLPAQTITTGFGSMGQGRYVHPSKPRTITPHEAARLQAIPDFWDLSAARTRGSLARLIGNAAPPPLSEAVIREVLIRYPSLVTVNPSAVPQSNGDTRPSASSEAARNRMKATRREGTTAEMAVRLELDRLKLVYSTNEPPEPRMRRRADMVFRDARVAVFIDGCFWHSCPTHATQPKSNAAWWLEKLEANERRDRDTDTGLRQKGWRVLRFWEHEDPLSVAWAAASVVNMP